MTALTRDEEIRRTREMIGSLTLSPHNAPTRIIDGAVVCEPARKKVCIVGFGQTSQFARHFQDKPDWEIWGINNGYRNPVFYEDEPRRGEDNDGPWYELPTILRVDRWFELHPMRVQPFDDLEWMKACPVPIYVLDLNDPHPQGVMPTAVQFPLEQCHALARMSAPFWACTFAYQLALAVLDGFEEIAILGLDFGTPREWIMERPNTLWWAGFAAGRGVRLAIPAGSTLLEHKFRYGYDYEAEKSWCEERIEVLMEAWGFVERPEAAARRRRAEALIEDAIPR